MVHAAFVFLGDTTAALAKPLQAKRFCLGEVNDSLHTSTVEKENEIPSFLRSLLICVFLKSVFDEACLPCSEVELRLSHANLDLEVMCRFVASRFVVWKCQWKLFRGREGLVMMSTSTA